MALARLIYFSRYRLDLRDGRMTDQLNALLAASQRNNMVNGITGCLIIDSEWFVQALEGEVNTVWLTYKRIEPDNRHDDVRFVEMAAAQTRSFGEWWMGCAERNATNEASFAPYLRAGRFNPPALKTSELSSLLTDLAIGSLGHRLAELAEV